MVQPKTPPISLRIPAHFLSELEAWAAKTGRTRNGAMIWLMAKGLAAENLAQEAASSASLAAAQAGAAKVMAAKAEKPEPFKTRLKGEWKAP
jgi:hypothetical protein